MTRLHHLSVGPRSDRADAPVIVLVGSIGSSLEMWLPQMDALSADSRVIALDHPGHGRTPVPGSGTDTFTVADIAAAVLETLDSLGVDKFHLAGLSLGGAVAQFLAAGPGHDRVQALALLCTASKFGTPDSWLDRAATVRAHGTSAVADATVEKWFTEEWRLTHPATTEIHRRMVSNVSAEGYALCCEALAAWDFTSGLPGISTPTLTIAGSADPSTPPEALQSIADVVPGALTAVIDPGAHVPTIERPNEVSRLLAEHFGVTAGAVSG
jgi:3-oxoadipate enol-lactonase